MAGPLLQSNDDGMNELEFQTVLHKLVHAHIRDAVAIVQGAGTELVYVARIVPVSYTHLELSIPMRTPKSANGPRSNSFRPDSPLTTASNRGRKTQPAPSPHRTWSCLLYTSILAENSKILGYDFCRPNRFAYGIRQCLSRPFFPLP